MRRTAALLVATCAVLAACSAHGAEPAPAPTSPPVSTAPPTTAAAPTPTSVPPPGADRIRTEGAKVTSGGAAIRVLVAAGVEMKRIKDDDGSVHLRFDPGSTPPGEPIAFVAGSRASAFADGTALAGRGGLNTSGSSLRDSSKGVLALYVRADDPEPTLWFAGTAVDDTDWGVREGGKSLAVTPSAWARDGGLAASELTWAQLVALEPNADSGTVRDQLRCHQLGAPDKATWNLEPWRPQVDGLALIAARCNPT
jgi:hypothetical protein